MARHASAERQRRLAAWPIVLAVGVLVLGALIAGYFIVVNSADKTTDCTGSTVLPVTVSPGAARAIGDAASAFNATKPVARSTCVSVSVTTMAGSAAESALAGGWKGQASVAPGLWVVDSVADLATLDASSSSPMTAGHANTSLATSPVVLAMRAAPAVGTVSWKSLAAGASGSPVLAVPDPATNRASSYALQSLVAASSGGGSVKAIGAAAVAGSVPLLNRLAAASPTPPPTTSAALTALAAGQGAFTAVPVVESELAAFNRSHGAGFTAIYPAGPAAGDEMLAVPLTASWVTSAMSDAAAAFDAFLGDPKGIAILAAGDLRVSGTSAGSAGPDDKTGVDEKATVTVLPDAAPAVRKALASAWAAASSAAPGGTATTSLPAVDPTAPGTPSSGSTPVSPQVTSPTTTASTGADTNSKTTAATVAGPTTLSPTTRHSSIPAPSTVTAPAAVTPARPSTPVSAITLVLDTSGSMKTVDSGLERITWMQEAVDTVIGRNPTDLFGLWTFSTQNGSSGYMNTVPLGALGDRLNGSTRAATITATVDELTPNGASWTYGAIRAAYTKAAGAAVAGRANRIIVVTDGADTTPSLSRSALKSSLSALAGRGNGVELDIIGLSSSVNAAALTEIAQAGGGRFTPLSHVTDLQSTLLELC